MAPAQFATLERVGLVAICVFTCCIWGITSQNYAQDFIYLILASLAYVVGFSNSKSGKGKPSAEGAKRVDDDHSFARRHRLFKAVVRPTETEGGDEGGVPEGSAEGGGERKTWFAPKAFRCDHKYNSTQRREMLMKVIETAQKDGYDPDIPSFQVLIEAACVCEHVEISLHVFGRMLETNAIQRIYPDWINKGLAKTFFKMVSENLDEESMRLHGLELLRLIQACGIEPTKYFQNLVIVAWKSKPPEYVLNFLLQMRQWGVLLSSTAYRCIMIASERSDPAKTIMLFEEMLEFGVKVDAATFNAAMCASCQLGRPLDALKIAEQMPGANAERNGKTYGILIDACTAANKNKEAEELLDAMVAAGYAPNRFAYDDVIWCCIREEKVDKAIKLYKQMIDEEHLPCKNTRDNMIQVCTRKGRMADIEQLIGHVSPHAPAPIGVLPANGANRQRRPHQQAPPQPQPANPPAEAAEAPEAAPQVKVARFQKAAAGEPVQASSAGEPAQASRYQKKAVAGEAAGEAAGEEPVQKLPWWQKKAVAGEEPVQKLPRWQKKAVAGEEPVQKLPRWQKKAVAGEEPVQKPRWQVKAVAGEAAGN